MRKKDVFIVCPNCGREYLPAEIYVPTTLLGKPSDIERDPTGKIVSFTGSSMDTTESYVCDGCSTPFTVYARVQFTPTVSTELDFNNEYKTVIKK